ncbi:hypothetical protein GOP47_0003511 [Adiantum capillus-veneris]|uniref:Uncharacterized protein n=1 Tax=Adiantum capillus-veneris TaxID=13818 RepID=A0A9D4ZQ81_ADICA|nr:hypothetical protein GOP47_0003511 [Adiantum capillus-veneris]
MQFGCHINFFRATLTCTGLWLYVDAGAMKLPNLIICLLMQWRAIVSNSEHVLMAIKGSKFDLNVAMYASACVSYVFELLTLMSIACEPGKYLHGRVKQAERGFFIKLGRQVFWNIGSPATSLATLIAWLDFFLCGSSHHNMEGKCVACKWSASKNAFIGFLQVIEVFLLPTCRFLKEIVMVLKPCTNGGPRISISRVYCTCILVVICLQVQVA